MPRALKIPVWILGSLVALVALLLLAVLIIGNTESGRALVVRMTSRLTDGHVQLAGINGSFPAALDLDKLQLSDAQGVWLVAEHISLRWSPAALLAGHLEVDTLHVSRLHVERAPVSAPDDKPSSEFSFPHTDVAHLSVDELELGAPLAGAPASLVLSGSAHWRSMRDALATITAQRTGGIGNYDLQVRFNDDRMDATVKLQEPANGPLENLLQVPGLGDLSVVAELSGPRTAETLHLRLDAGAMHGRASGTLNLNTAGVDLDYSLTAASMTPHPELTWQSIDLQGRWHGSASAPVADGRLLIKQLQIPGGTRLEELAANLTARDGLLTARATLTGLIIPGPTPGLMQDAPLTVNATAQLNDPRRPVEVTATHKLFGLQAHAITTGEQSAQLNLQLPDVAPFAATAGYEIKGPATIKAHIIHTTNATNLTADVNTNIDGGAASWAGLLRGGETRLQLAGAMTNAKIQIDKLQLNGPAVHLGAEGSVVRTGTRDLDIRLNLGLPDLARVSPGIAGTLKLSGRVSGPGNSLSTTADVTSTLSVHGSPTGSLAASVQAEGLPNEPRGIIEAHGDLDGAPLRLNVSLERDKGNVVHALVRHADWKSAHIEGDIATRSTIAQTRGNLRLRMDQLGDLNRLLGTNLQGGVAGTVTLTPARPQSHAQISLEAHDVVAGGMTADAKLTANGTMDALNVQLDAQSPAIGGEPASLSSMSVLNITGHELRFTGLEARYHGQTIKLLAPAAVSFANGLAIRDLELGAREAVLAVDGSVSPALDLRVSLRQLEPDLINAFWPKLLASGTIQANARIQGSSAAPTGNVHLEALNMRSANNAALGLPAADLRADAQLMGNTTSVDARLIAGSGSNLKLEGQAPLAADGALDLKLTGSMDVGLLNPLTEPSGKHVTGALTIDTTITGARAAPEIGGSVRLAKGSVRDYTQGINLTDITGELTGNHGTLEIRNLTARAAPGDVSVTGMIGVLQPNVPVDLKLTAKNAQPISSNIITANVDADIEVNGTAQEKLNVNGKVRVNRANIEIPSGFPPDVAVLDVRRPGKAPPPLPEKPLIIVLNITIDAPRQILVKGRGLDAELGGELRVRGTSDAPVVGGSFDLQRGTFTLGSSQLDFSTQSTVTFNGEGLKKKLDPTLDFTASSQVLDVTATVKITGLADQPKIELSSIPDLPQDEIMARLLFGQSASQLTALQVVQIGAALATLTGGGGGLNPLTKLQKTLGLDRLTFGSDSNNGATANNTPQNSGYNVEAGRYVSSRVFVAVKESTTGFSQLVVNVDLTKRLKLQTRLSSGSTNAQGVTPDNDPGNSVGLSYQFEY